MDLFARIRKIKLAVSEGQLTREQEQALIADLTLRHVLSLKECKA